MREEIQAGKLAQRENDPYGYGGGIVGNSMTVLAKAGQAKADALAEVPEKARNAAGMAALAFIPGGGMLINHGLQGVDAAGYSSFDRQRDAAAQLKAEQGVKEQERVGLMKKINTASEREVELTRMDIAGGRLQVSLLRLRSDLEGKIASARSRQAGPSVLADIEAENRLLREQAKLRHRSEYGSAVEANLAAGIRPGISQEFQRARVARLGLGFQYRTALSRPGGMFKTEALDWQTKLRGADANVNAAALDAKRRADAVNEGRREIANQRELLNLGHQDIESRSRRAELDVQAATAAREQSYNLHDYIRANGEVRKALSQRVLLEKQSFAVQHAQGELAYDLARRTGQIEATNTSDFQKRASVTQASLASMRAELTLSKGLSVPRRRELELGIAGGENDLRLQRQERAFGKSPLRLQREMLAERNRKRRLDFFDRQIERTNGLTGIRRDINGNIESGIDILTGERRGLITAAARRENNPTVNVAQQMLTAQLNTNKAIDTQTAKLITAIESLGLR